MKETKYRVLHHEGSDLTKIMNHEEAMNYIEENTYNNAHIHTNVVGLTLEQQRKLVMFTMFVTLMLVIITLATIVWANKYDNLMETNKQLSSQITSLQHEVDKKNSEVVSLQYQIDELKK